MNLQENIRRILREDHRVYDYKRIRNTVPYEERLPFDIDKLISVGAVFVTPAIDADSKKWLKEPYVHLITLKNIIDAEPDSWVHKAITKTADPEPYRNDLVSKIYDGKYNQILWSLEELGIDPNDMLIDKKHIEETIKRILREESYSPAGDEYEPGKVVVHKSNPVWRDNIRETGLQVSVGECYRQYVGMDLECKKAIFATDSLKEEDIFDSTYDDDIWLIDTECAGVNWFKDKHFEDSDYEYHIVTFEDISPECLKLIYKGTGKSY